MSSSYPKFPVRGAKLKFKGSQKHFWFTDILANADVLTVGKVYTLEHIEVFSSWCCVKLKETGELEFSLSFFEECP